MNLNVKAIEKLVDYVASGIGSVAGSMLAPWRARQEAQAKQIAARGDADVLLIQADAQAKAREILVSQDTDVTGELDMANTVNQRIQFQERKRQANIASVVTQAASQLGDKEVANHEPDHDWTARFFNNVQDVSSEEMQGLWAKVLAGEVERAGSASLRTLGILKDLDQPTAELFRILCSARIIRQIGQKENSPLRFGNDMVLSLDKSAARNSLKEFGLDYNSLNRLNEHGLITPEYDSWLEHKVWDSGLGKSPRWISVSFCFQGRNWILEPVDQRQGDQRVDLRGILLTNAGMELASFVDIKLMPEYHKAVTDFFEKSGFRMVEFNFDTADPPRD